MNKYCVTAITLVFAAVGAEAACPKYEQISAVADAYKARLPIPPFDNLRNALEAYCAQGKLAAEIGRTK